MAAPRTVVIVGSGFSGVITAVHLLRSDLPLRIVQINRSGPQARGLAYGTRSAAHLLNVPAGRMSAFPDDEESFLRFVRQQDPTITGGAFVPRRWYGEYLESLLTTAAAKARHAQLERIVDEVADLTLSPGRRTAIVITRRGRSFLADRVVLALGNFAPADPPLEDRSFFRSPRYIRDPWSPGALNRADPAAPALLIGTGLTMVDIALQLQERGHRGPLHALSRRGLLPQSHRSPGVPPAFTHRPPDIETGPATALAYLRSVRRHVRTLAAQGIDWREVIGALRPITPQLWAALSIAERARFLRHVRSYWEVHRHRAAPEIAAALAEMTRTGRLTIHAGRLRSLETVPDKVAVRFRPRRTATSKTLEVGAVINCTGPDSDVRGDREPLLASLSRQRLLIPDPLGLGLLTAPNYALLNARHQPSEVLFYVGPLLKAMWWESTAVPELRLQAQALAESLIRSLSAELLARHRAAA